VDAYGLIGVAEGVHNASLFANRLKDDTIAIAICRILNDFRPLEKIVDSLWEATPEGHRLPYLCAALAMHCHAVGLRYSILQKIAGQKSSLSNLFENAVPLGLTTQTEDDEFVVPMNAVH